MRYLNKRGISPLIATILLIGFTVALAAVVITWGSGFVDRITSGTEDRTTRAIICTSDLNFDILKVTCDTNPADPAAGVSTVIVDNKGDIAITGLVLRFFKDNGDSAGVVNTESVDAFEVKTINLYPGTVPQKLIPAGTTKVEALATIDLDSNVTCADTPKEKIFSPAC